MPRIFLKNFAGDKIKGSGHLEHHGEYMRFRCKLGLWQQVGLGFLLGIQSIATIMHVISRFCSQNAQDEFWAAVTWIGGFGWLYDYQQLITGLAAVIAAFLSIRYIRLQIAQTSRLEVNRRTGKREAARAMLQLSVTQLCEYAKASASLVQSIVTDPATGHPVLPTPVTVVPQIPNGPLEVLRDLIEYSKSAERIYYVKMMSSLQVQNSKLVDLIDNIQNRIIVSGRDLECYIYDAAEVYAYASALFKYSRGKTTHVPLKLEAEDIFNAIHITGIRGSDEEKLNAKAQRLFANGWYD